MEVFLLEPYIINAIETQGAGDREEWVTKYQLMYRLSIASLWHFYSDDSGNTIVSTSVICIFRPLYFYIPLYKPDLYNKDLFVT